MSGNRFGTLFQYQSWGESHGPAIGCVVDGVPPRIPLSEADIQPYLDRRKPGQSRYTTQRQEADSVKILSGTFEGQTTGTPISLLIENTDAKSKDYADIKNKFRPGHADYPYQMKYGIRDYRGGGRSSARETAMRVAAGAVARKILPGVQIRAAVVQGYLGGTVSPALIPGHGCDFVPNLHRYADMSDVMRLAAPRPVLYIYPRGRASSAVVKHTFDRMRPIYEVFSCPDRTRFYEQDAGDEYNTEMAAMWFERWLMEEEDTDVLLWAPRE